MQVGVSKKEVLSEREGEKYKAQLVVKGYSQKELTTMKSFYQL